MTQTSPLTDPRGALMALVDKALRFADDLAAKRVAQLRAERPHDTPAHVIEQLERQFSQTVTMTGAGTGALAAAPGVGLPLAVGASTGDMLAMLTAAGTHVLGVARVHGVPLGDIDTDGLDIRRTLLFGVLLGNTGTKLIVNTASRTGAQWGRAIAGSMSVQVLRTLNRRLGGLLLRRVAPLLGLGAAVKFVPLGVGAVLGGTGNFFMAKQVIASTHDAFGEAPTSWPGADAV